MQNGLKRVSPWVLVAALSSCHERPLGGVSDAVSARPSEVDFGAVALGASTSVTVEFEGRGALSLELSAPFSAHPSTLSAPAEAVITFRPEAVGPRSIDLTLPGGARLRLAGVGVAAGACESTKPCVSRTWSAREGRCVELAKRDGEACEQVCLEVGHCVSGQCVGRTPSCDDANACTADSCDSKLGCTHATIGCAPASSPCLAPSCDPSAGCTLAPVIDGTRCGPRDCATAHVCVAGTCVTRAVPDGAPCGGATTCRAEGVCQGGACLLPPPHKLQLAWRRQLSSIGGLIFPSLEDASGNLYWLEEYRRLVSVTPAGVVRFEVPVGISVNQVEGPNDTVILAGDLIILSHHQDRFLEARRQSDGSLVWQRSFPLVDSWPRNITDLAWAGADLFVVSFDSPLSHQRAGLTVLSCIELASGTIRWERSTGGSSEIPTAAYFIAPTVAVDSLGPVVGTAYGEHQDSAQGRFQMIAYTTEGDVRWARSSLERVISSIDDRVFFRSAFSLGWVTPDGGTQLVPSSIPSAPDRPVPLLTDAGVVIGAIDSVPNVFFLAEHTNWRILSSFRPSAYFARPVTPPVLAANGLISFVANDWNVLGVEEPVVVETNPTTGAISKCAFELDPFSTFDTLSAAVELPGLIVFSDRSKSRVWAFRR